MGSPRWPCRAEMPWCRPSPAARPGKAAVLISSAYQQSPRQHKIHPRGVGGCQAAGIINIQEQTALPAAIPCHSLPGWCRRGCRPQPKAPHRSWRCPEGKQQQKGRICIWPSTHPRQSQLQGHSPRVSKAMEENDLLNTEGRELAGVRVTGGRAGLGWAGREVANGHLVTSWKRLK